MGIVNLTADSFCNDGILDADASVARAFTLAQEGADIIDVGAESARTNRGPVEVGEETARLKQFLETYAQALPDQPPPQDEAQIWPPLLSINTWRPEVVEAILPLGVDILNDIGALPDDTNARLCAQYETALLVMHSIGQPKVPHLQKQYPDIMTTLHTFFQEKLAMCRKVGLDETRVILDPGIDFAKQRADNLRIYAELQELQKFDRPILLPVSRKTVIGEVLEIANPRDRDAGTIACIAAGMQAGAHIYRAHNVPATVQAVKALWAIHNHS